MPNSVFTRAFCHTHVENLGFKKNNKQDLDRIVVWEKHTLPSYPRVDDCKDLKKVAIYNFLEKTRGILDHQ